MTKERRETNPKVRQNRTPGEESRRNHHWKGNRSDERAVAVTTQESPDGIREKARRIASVDESGAESDRTRQANELVRSLVSMMKKEGDIIVASCSKSKL